ncbi:MAG: methyltransferase domain-containing protein [Betaproteobacteria bacterium]
MNPDKSPAFVDRRQVRRSFARAAARYPEHDFLAREIDARMQSRLDYVRLSPGLIVDVGCSRGASLAGLRQRYPEAATLGLDLVPEMLRNPEKSIWRRWLPLPGENLPQFAAGDAVALPVRSGAAGLIWSNLLLHWLDDPIPALTEMYRALEVGGLLMFSALGPDTLKELRASFGDGHAHSQRFIDMHDLGDMLVGCGFSDPVMDMEMMTLTYPSFPALVAELRASGGRCAMNARSRTLTGKSAWQAVTQAYEAQASEGRLPASFEVIYGHAWKAAPKNTPDGRAIIRFEKKRA